MASVGSIVVNIMANVAPFHRGISVARGMMGSFVNYITAASGLAFGALATDYEMFNRAVAKGTAPIELSKRSLVELRYEFIELSRTSVYSATEIANSFKTMIQGGLDAKQALEALPVAIQFGQAGDMDSIEKATDMLLKSQAALDMKSKDPAQNMKNMKELSDLLTGAQLATTASLEEMGEALQNKAAGAIRSYNLGLEESIALLALFHAAGITGEKAGTAFNIVVRDWTTQFIKHADAWEQMNVHVYDTNGNMNSMIGILRQLENAMAGVSDEQKKERLISLGFADRSAAFTAAIMGKSEAFYELLQRLKEVDGLTAKIAYRNMTDFQRAWHDLTASVRNFSESAMPPVFRALGFLIYLASRVIDIMGQVGKVIRITGDEHDRISARILVAAAAFITFISVATVVIKTISALVVALKAFTKAQTIAEAFSGPKGWAIIAGGIFSAGTAVLALDGYYAELDATLAGVTEGTGELDEMAQKLQEDMKKFMESLNMDDTGPGAGPLGDIGEKMDDLSKKAASLTESLRTPFEVMQDEIKIAFDYLMAGLISAETYTRAVKKARADYRSAMDKNSNESDPHKAFIRGSTEEWSARFGTARDMKEMAEKELAELKAIKEAVKALPKALTGMGTPVWEA